ncbi:hypothetical protein BJ508DRAFT_411368 [Ascobolus immersus RN42]|uniref:Mus7/MMS22 family-domain-containing protein n=1 Tax=Ascobolus immersus RN42 TaxID=1160509 RepID=A0A3N4IJ57_ASCIM|nr:hypothetical protein BJ508DRAFT_411368 [Ascobolus immersus RN42]
MQSWRERGYVPDSDEEDEDFESQPKSVAIDEGTTTDPVEAEAKEKEEHDLGKGQLNLSVAQNNSNVDKDDGPDEETTRAGNQKEGEIDDNKKDGADDKTPTGNGKIDYYDARKPVVEDKENENDVQKHTDDGKSDDNDDGHFPMEVDAHSPDRERTPTQRDHLPELPSVQMMDAAQYSEPTLPSVHMTDAAPAGELTPRQSTFALAGPSNDTEMKDPFEFFPSSSPLSDPPSRLPSASPQPSLPFLSPPATSQPSRTQTQRPAKFSIMVPARSAGTTSENTGESANVAAQEGNDESHEVGKHYARSLRDRKPIQLNPYQIEQIMYKKTIRGAGLKPVRLKEVEEEAERHRPHPQQDSSQEEFDGSTVVEEDRLERLPQRHRERSGSTGHRHEPRSGRAAPDANGHQILRGIQRDFETNKRRKLSHTYGSKSSSTASHVTQADGDATSRRLHRLSSEPWEMPSEPSMEVSDNTRRQIDSDFEAEEEENATTTQSEPSRSTSIMRKLLSPSPSPPPQDPSPSPEPSPPDGSPESGSDDDVDSADLRILGKKTRGVLPASYHVFNHETANNRRKAHRTPKVVPSGPGIARTKISSRPRSRDRDLPVVDEDESESDGIQPTQPHIQTPFTLMAQRTASSGESRRERSTQPVVISDDDDDIMEDNRVDAMLQSTGRSRRKSSSAKSKPKPKTSTSKSRTSRVSTASGTSKKQTRINSFAGKSSNRKQSRRTAPRIGIVDAYFHQMTKAVTPSAAISKAPDFVRVAQRQARKRSDLGRTGPEGKLFILDTAEDTREVQGTLRNWRENTLGFDDRTYREQTEPYLRRAKTARRRAPATQRIRQSAPSTKQVRSSNYDRPAPKLQTTLSFTAAPKNDSNGSIIQSASMTKPGIPTFGRGGLIITAPRRNLIRDKGPRFLPADNDLAGVDHDGSDTTINVWEPLPLIEALHARGSQAQARPVRPVSKPTDVCSGKRLGDKSTSVPFQRSALAPLSKPSVPRPRKLQRKHKPHHVDTASLEHQLSQQVFARPQTPASPADTSDAFMDSSEFGPTPTHIRFKGFPWEVRKFTKNFGVSTPRPGTYFNDSTFLGSGGLKNVLSITSYRMASGFEMPAEFAFDDFSFVWGSYGDHVASGFEAAMEHVLERLDTLSEADTQSDSLDAMVFLSRSYNFFQFCSGYISKTLCFADAIDVKDFGHRWMRVLRVAFERICGLWSPACTSISPEKASTRLAIQCLMFLVIFGLQVKLTTAADQDFHESAGIPAFLQSVTGELVRTLMRCGAKPINACFEQQRQLNYAESGIGQEHYLVETWVVATRLCSTAYFPSPNVYTNEVNKFLKVEQIDDVTEFDALESIWGTVFSLLPVSLFDDHGMLDLSTEHPQLQNWRAVREVLGRAFTLYEQSPKPSRLNGYIRTVITRCHVLISKWKWTRCGDILIDIYKFYTRRDITDLSDEVDRGSAQFLRDLAKAPNLEPNDSDSTFQVFLKTIAVGIDQLRQIVPERKVGLLVSQLVPNANHNRKYPRDQEIKLEHFTLLRNHHDLLCTLYWVAPQRYRPPLDAISSLVDPSVAHRRACSINIRAWDNLITFQLHDNADAALIEPFMEWFEHMVNQIFEQHQSARAEAVRDVEAAKKNGIDVSEGTLEAHVRRNQRQIESLLIEAMNALTPTFRRAGQNRAVRSLLLSRTVTWTVFDASYRMSHKVVLEAITILESYLAVQTPKPTATFILPQDSEDSQDYGDFSGFEEILNNPEFCGPVPNENNDIVQEEIYDSFHRMLSSFFGSDEYPEDKILVKLVDTWVSLASAYVKSGKRKWDSYFGRYGKESWAALRDTEQTRKFAPYFMSQVLNKDPGAYQDHKWTFLTFWFKSLIERESLLKYQHELTTSILNIDKENPILQNLPFIQDTFSDTFTVSFLDLKNRRLSLISTVLWNMRSSFLRAPSREVVSLKQSYTEVLQETMSAMKENHQALLANSNHTGTYVGFVQQVVEYLQQYTVEITPIDKYFTESSPFPLPTTDPTYVVGKLKYYGLRLDQTSHQYQLISFLNTTAEKAVLECHQEYLKGQLCTAMNGASGLGDEGKAKLRRFFLQAVVPAYIMAAFGSSPGKILIAPILEATIDILEHVEEDVDPCDVSSIGDALGEVEALISAIWAGLIGVLKSGRISEETICLIVQLFPVLGSCAELLDWLVPLSEDTAVTEGLKGLIMFAHHFPSTLSRSEDLHELSILCNAPASISRNQGRDNCAQDLSHRFQKWSRLSGEWKVSQNGPGKPVPVPTPRLPSLAELRADLTSSARDLLRLVCRTERWSSLVRQLQPGIWEVEGRRNGAAGVSGIGLDLLLI